MGCSPAPTLTAALAELDTLHPGRVHGGEGVCGQRANKSDHPIGNAMDVWHDPEHGADMNVYAAALVARRDPRVTYLIWNRRIYGPESRYGWEGGPYTGASPHTDHLHVSIYPTARNNMGAWWGGAQPNATPPGSGGPAEPMSTMTPTGSIIPGVDEVKSLGKALTFLTDKGNWLRLATFGGGCTLLVVAVVMWVGSAKVLRKAAAAATSAYTGGVVKPDLEIGDESPTPFIDTKDEDEDDAPAHR